MPLRRALDLAALVLPPTSRAPLRPVSRIARCAVPALVCAMTFAACTSPPTARAKRVETRAELIGGPRALGEVGDWLLENGKARFLIQDAGFSRGFGVFGGALLDADLVRPQTGRGNSEGGVGKDNFGEMFPAFFLEALEPREVSDPDHPGTRLPAIEVERDGSDGGDAILVVRGTGGDFLALTQRLNETLLGDERRSPSLFLETRYILHPDAQYLEMTTRVRNIRAPAGPVELPNASFGGSEIPTPFGDVMLFGAGNKVFAPDPAGYDIRFSLEDKYKNSGVTLPALPGLIAEFLASSGNDVSYGVLAKPPEAPTENFAFKNKDQFPEATTHSVHIPFIASAFTGVFQVTPPSSLAPDDGQPGGADEMSFTRYFIVGDGDVASISDVVYALLGDTTGTLQGRLTAEGDSAGIDDARVIVLSPDGAKVTEMTTTSGGRFDAHLRPGSYSLVVQKDGWAVSPPTSVAVVAEQTAHAELRLPRPAQIAVTVVDPDLGRIPAKVTLVGTTPPEHVGQDAKSWLFDLSLGEGFRYTDFVPDDANDPSTLRYIETTGYTSNGTFSARVRPGTYDVVVSRGGEYDRDEHKGVVIASGQTASLTATLHHVVDTTGYISGDFHLHSRYSLDSGESLEDRITSYAGEGVELAVSTDHNFVVDYQPVIGKLGLDRFIGSMVGLELTTIDRGHFNGYPLQLGTGSLAAGKIASRTYGSFEWALRDPQDIFDDLRGLGRKKSDGSTSEIILQVNHPRDSILGYFDQYGVNADTLEVEGQSGLIAPDPTQHPEFSKDAFSFDFDAMEVFNGKRFEFLKTFRVPDSAPVFDVDTNGDGTAESTHVDPASCCPVEVGAVLREGPSLDCGDAVPDEECVCTAARAQAQVDAGKCNIVGPVAFPGVLDDWLRVLETGKHVVGTANSDSHDPDNEEPGSPRTFIAVGKDDPAQVSNDDVVAAFHSGNVVMSNGPFLRVTTGDNKTLGGTATASGGTVSLHVHVEQAPWVRADTVRVYRGIEVVAEQAIDGDVNDLDLDVPVSGDTFLVVEAQGSESLFPSVLPNEIPPLQFTDVIGALGSSFGFGSSPGALEPELTFVTTPYAATNPIWVDADGDGTVTPSRAALGAQASTAHAQTAPQRGSLVRPVAWVPTEAEARADEERALWQSLPVRKRATLQRLPRWLWPSNDPHDIRRVLVQFVRHGH